MTNACLRIVRDNVGNRPFTAPEKNWKHEVLTNHPPKLLDQPSKPHFQCSTGPLMSLHCPGVFFVLAWFSKAPILWKSGASGQSVILYPARFITLPSPWLSAVRQVKVLVSSSKASPKTHTTDETRWFIMGPWLHEIAKFHRCML